MHIPFRSLNKYNIPEFQQINFPEESSDISLIFSVSADQLTDRHKNMIIKMANDVQLYIGSHSLILPLPKNSEFDWTMTLKHQSPLKLVFFGSGLHSLTNSIFHEWHHLQQHMFLNTYPLIDLATEKSKAVIFWKAFKPLFN